MKRSEQRLTIDATKHLPENIFLVPDRYRPHTDRADREGAIQRYTDVFNMMAEGLARDPVNVAIANRECNAVTNQSTAMLARLYPGRAGYGGASVTFGRISNRRLAEKESELCQQIREKFTAAMIDRETADNTTLCEFEAWMMDYEAMAIAANRLWGAQREIRLSLRTAEKTGRKKPLLNLGALEEHIDGSLRSYKDEPAPLYGRKIRILRAEMGPGTFFADHRDVRLKRKHDDGYWDYKKGYRLSSIFNPARWHAEPGALVMLPASDWVRPPAVHGSPYIAGGRPETRMLSVIDLYPT